MKTFRLFATVLIVALCSTLISCGNDDDKPTQYELDWERLVENPKDYISVDNYYNTEWRCAFVYNWKTNDWMSYEGGEIPGGIIPYDLKFTEGPDVINHNLIVTEVRLDGDVILSHLKSSPIHIQFYLEPTVSRGFSFVDPDIILIGNGNQACKYIRVK